MIGLGMPVLVALALLMPRGEDMGRLACERAATLRTGQFIQETFEHCLAAAERPTAP